MNDCEPVQPALENAGSGIIVGVDFKPLHTGDEGCATDPHACRCSLGASNPAFAFGQYANDLIVLLLGMFA